MHAMTRKLMLGAVVGASLLGFGVLGGSNAQAAFMSCSGPGYDISNNVDVATDCTISDANQDFLNTDPITVNEDGGFFGHTDWSFFGKIGTNEGADLTGAGDGTGQSGDINLTGLGLDVNKTMLVFKDGGDTTLVGYLISNLLGSWDSPFVEPPFDFPGQGPRDVSHISVYSKQDGGGNPLPATFLLFGAGLLGLGLGARRYRQ